METNIITNMDLTPPDLQWLGLDVVLHLTLFLLVTYNTLKSKKEPASKVLWILSAWFLPILGPLIYLMFGINRVERKAWKKHSADKRFKELRETVERDMPAVYWKAVHPLIGAQLTNDWAKELNKTFDRIQPEYPLLAGNKIELLLDGDEAYPAMLKAIENAQHHIHIQSFIIANDKIGIKFMELLKKKAIEGITVRLLYDRFGSTKALFSRLFLKYQNIPNFKICGWTQANPLKRQFQINLRNHRKIAVIDGKIAFTGGMNIIKTHSSDNGNPPEIRDYHFILEGPIAQELQYSFLKDWYFMTEESPDILLQSAHFPEISNKGNALIRVINSGPTPDEMEMIGKVFFESMLAAKREIIAVTPYFVPTREIMEAFFSCARRGVEVKLLVPKKNNHFYAGLAGKALYEDLLKAGIRIFERHPPFMHSKAFLVDDKIAIVGSANIDIRSISLNYETNLAIFDEDNIHKIRRVVEKEFLESDELSIEKWQQRSQLQQFLENLFYLFAPML